MDRNDGPIPEELDCVWKIETSDQSHIERNESRFGSFRVLVYNNFIIFSNII